MPKPKPKAGEAIPRQAPISVTVRLDFGQRVTAKSHRLHGGLDLICASGQALAVVRMSIPFKTSLKVAVATSTSLSHT